MEFLRTPAYRFDNIPRYPFLPRYVVLDPETGMRMHFVSEGRPDGPIVLMLHGEPTWSYLYRRLITMVAEAGYRVIAPDLIGFGRSDKPKEVSDYSYASHLSWLTTFIDALELDQIALVCHDWGGLLGLRMVAAQPDRFSRIVATNTFLPTGLKPMPEAFYRWRKMSQNIAELDVGLVIQAGTLARLPESVIEAYRAPFPDESFMAGVRSFPMLVPTEPDDPEAIANQAAWQILASFEKPSLMAFSDSDPITSGMDVIMRQQIPGAAGTEPVTIRSASHFIQEDRGSDLAVEILRFFAEHPGAKPKKRAVVIAPTIEEFSDLEEFDDLEELGDLDLDELGDLGGFGDFDELANKSSEAVDLDKLPDASDPPAGNPLGIGSETASQAASPDSEETGTK